MSRSRKKHPCSGSNDRFAKRQANRAVRRYLKNQEADASGKKYRRCYQSWEICDYYHLEPTFESFYEREMKYYNCARHIRKNIQPPSREELYRFYKKAYVNK